MGLSLFIMAISGYTAFMASMSLPLSTENPFANEREGRNMELLGGRKRPTVVALHFPFLSLLDYSIFNYI
jgi:hypothetical protein